MQINSTRLFKSVGIGLRILGFVWPFSAEVLALLWWHKGVDSSIVIVQLVQVGSYVFLIFFPNRLVFSKLGLIAASLLGLGALLSVGLTVERWGDIPDTAIVHVVLAALWGSLIWVAQVLGKRLNSTSLS